MHAPGGPTYIGRAIAKNCLLCEKVPFAQLVSKIVINEADDVVRTFENNLVAGKVTVDEVAGKVTG